MRMYDLIYKKKNGGELSREEIRQMIAGYTAGDIPDYQMSAFLMAVCFQGMSDEEMTALTEAMAHSGEMIDLSSIDGIKVDKHSTGGVGDKTTMVIGPIVAANGVKVAKMSGRGLGHTGGTLDKLESIPGMRTSLSLEEFSANVSRIGIGIMGQTGNLVPADKMLYALRDVTATVDSVPLIASSVMSKKLAAGSDCIVLDVKTGSGAFMKNTEDSILLAEKMVTIGEQAGRRMVALITDMDIPLGNAVGNALEVKEAVHTLMGQGPEDFTEICVNLAGNMLYAAGRGTIEHCKMLARQAIEDGSGLEKLAELVEAQGGDAAVIRDLRLLGNAPFEYEVKALQSGYVVHMDTEACGIASMLLGAGRETRDSVIDPLAGLILKKKTGDYVGKGETLAVLYASDKERFNRAEEKLLSAYVFSADRPGTLPLILARVEKEKIERFE